jgi:hypothetical protein
MDVQYRQFRVHGKGFDPNIGGEIGHADWKWFIVSGSN